MFLGRHLIVVAPGRRHDVAMLKVERSELQVDASGRVRNPAGISVEQEAELLRLWRHRLG